MEAKNPKKERITIAVIGDYGCGKSTLGGTLLAKTGHISPRLITKLKDLSKTLGKFYRAWILDRTRLEVERGMTINGNLATLETTRYSVSWLDTPGHKSFQDKAVRMIAQADAIILVVDGTVGNDVLEKDLSRYGRLLQLAATCFMFGIRQMIVCVTQLDVVPTEHLQKDYLEKEEMIWKRLSSVGFMKKDVCFIPVSSRKNWNIVPLFISKNKDRKVEETLKWYKGRTLYDEIDRFSVRKKDLSSPALIQVVRAYRVGGVGTVVVGGVVRGVVKQGDILLVVPGMLRVQAKSIEVWRNPVTQAEAGLTVGICVPNLSCRDFSRGWRGFLVGLRNSITPPKEISLSSEYLKSSRFFADNQTFDLFAIPKTCNSFLADIVLVRTKIAKREAPFVSGASLVMQFRLMTQPVKLRKVWAKLNKKSFEAMEYSPDPDSFQNGDLIQAEFVSISPSFVQEADYIPEFSKFILIDNLGIVAAGVVRRHTSIPRPRIVIGHLEGCAPPTTFKYEKYFEFHFKSWTPKQPETLDQVNLIVLNPSDYAKIPPSILFNFVKHGGTLIADLGESQSTCNKLINQFGLSTAKLNEHTKESTYFFRLPNDKDSKRRSKPVKWPGFEIESRRAVLPQFDVDISYQFDLPPELVYHIFTFLRDETVLLSCARVCKMWNYLASSDSLWQDLVVRSGIGTFFSVGKEMKETNWKRHYANYYQAAKEGKHIVQGPFGKVSCFSFSTVPFGLLLLSEAYSPIMLARFHKKNNSLYGLALLSRFSGERQGQALFVVDTNVLVERYPANIKFVLNVLQDASRISYKHAQ